MAGEIRKPSRRAKKITISDQEIDEELELGGIIGRGSRNKKRSNLYSKNDNNGDQFEDNDELYESGSEGNRDEKDSQNDDEGYSDQETPKVQITKSRGGKFVTGFCSVCCRKKCSYKCRGPCKRSFHQTCMEKLESGWTGTKDHIDANFELEEMGINEQELRKRFVHDYDCPDCMSGVAYCFKCKQQGEFNLEELLNTNQQNTKNPEKASDLDDENETNINKKESLLNKDDQGMNGVTNATDNEINSNKMEEENINPLNSKKEQSETNPENHSCISPNGELNELDKDALLRCKKCLKFYHKKCVNEKVAKIKDKTLLKCEIHFCHKCKVFSEKQYSCVHCNISYHDKCLPKAIIKIISGRSFMCNNHTWNKVEKVKAQRNKFDKRQNKRDEKVHETILGK